MNSGFDLRGLTPSEPRATTGKESNYHSTQTHTRTHARHEIPSAGSISSTRCSMISYGAVDLFFLLPDILPRVVVGLGLANSSIRWLLLLKMAQQRSAANYQSKKR